MSFTHAHSHSRKSVLDWEGDPSKSLCMPHAYRRLGLAVLAAAFDEAREGNCEARTWLDRESNLEFWGNVADLDLHALQQAVRNI